MTVNVCTSFSQRRLLFMRIVRPICCGADIHKDLIVATIAATNQDGITEYIQSSFSSQNFDLVRLKAWLIEHHCFEIAMESTGRYWIPVFNVLEGEIKVFVVHPKYTKAIKGKKTDKKDSKWIVMRSSERNRYQNSMTISNIGLASILSDPFGKSSRAVMKEVIRSSSVTEERISKLLERNAKKKVKEVLQSLVGSHIESDQRLKMNIASQHMDQIDSHVRRLETEMAIRCIPYETLINLLLDIPGISYLSAMTIIAEIGTDMSVFETSKQLSCWAGLAPANNESANKKKSVRISKAGSYLKPLLVQCALAAINSKSNPYYRIKYNRIKKRRGHKKAIIAIARMILVNIYHILSTGEVYSPCDMEQIINPKPVKKVMTIQNAIEFLQSQGFDTSKLISSSS